MAILLRILIIIVSVLGFGAFGAMVVYIFEDERYEQNDDKGDGSKNPSHGKSKL